MSVILGVFLLLISSVAHATCDTMPTVHLVPGYKATPLGAGTVLVRPGAEADYLCTVRNNDTADCATTPFFMSVETAYGSGVAVEEAVEDSYLLLRPHEVGWTIVHIHVAPSSQPKHEVFVSCVAARIVENGAKEAEAHGRLVVIEDHSHVQHTWTPIPTPEATPP